jgi:putative peptidoglycan lipid II flippase
VGLSLILARRGHFQLDSGARHRLPRLCAAAIGAGMVLALLEYALNGTFGGNLSERGVALALLLGGGMATFFALAVAFSGIDRDALMRRLRRQTA